MSAGDSFDDDDQFEKTNIFSSVTRNFEGFGDLQVPPCLVLLVGPDDQMGRQWIVDRPSLVIGRIPTSEIHVADASLSKRHAQVDFANGQATITDLGSTNKTVVDGQILRPNEPFPLTNNNQIRTGGLVFKYLENGILSETSEKERMQSELESARTLQETLFPKDLEVRYEWLQIAGVYRSATEIGGDWWWHWSSGKKAFALIGDATGHGASAGLITSAARSAIATIEDDESVSLEKVYAVLTNAIQKCSGGRMAMSAFILEINLETRSVRYINASHLAAVVLPKQAAPLNWKNLETLGESVSSPLGSVDSKVVVGEMPAISGTRIVLLTDGLTERISKDSSALSERAFYSMLIHVHQSTLDSQSRFLKALMVQSDAVSLSPLLEDDITAVALDFS